jgi:hypothetical protein
MKRILFLFFLMLGGAIAAQAQSTTVSGTVTDAGSQVWLNGTYSFTFQPNPQFPTGPYTWTGGALNKVISGSLDGSGHYSVSIPSNSAITPAGSTWILTVTPNATSNSFSTPRTTITGGTQTLNVTPPAILISWSLPPGPAISAYSDSEIGGTLVPGSEYFNTTTLLTRVWNGSAWNNQGSGAGGGITGSGTTGFIPVFTGSTAIGNSHCDDGVTTAATVTCSQSFAVAANVTVPGTLFTGEVESVAATGGDLDIFCNAASSSCNLNFGSNLANEHVNFNGGPIALTGLTNITRTAPVITDTVGSASPVTPGSVVQRVVTTGPDTIVSTDRGNRVAYSSTSSVAVTLPQDGSSGFAGGFNMRVSNQNTGVVTITPTTSTINGNATLVLQEGQDCFITPDSTNTNWAADCNEPQMTFSGGITGTRGVHSLALSLAGSGSLTTNLIPKWNGTQFVNSSVTDNGTQVSTPEGVLFQPTGNGVSALQLVATAGTGNPDIFDVWFDGTFTTKVFSVQRFGNTTFSGNATVGGNAILQGNLLTPNCSSSASPAVCGTNMAGSVAIPAGVNSTLVVDTTAVDGNSQILLQIDEGLGSKLGITCNTTLSTLTHPVVTARTAGTSFTIQMSSTTTTNPVCVSYLVLN